MIIVRITAGLGNQMFQYAAGLALAEFHRTVLKLDVSWYRHYPGWEAHNRYALSSFNITEQFATQDEIERLRDAQSPRLTRWTVAAARRLHLNRYVQRHAPGIDWGKIFRHEFDSQFLQQPDGTHLQGLFQSEKYFANVAHLLRSHFSFRYPAHPEVLALAERIQSGPSIAVHFRRGDVVTNPRFRAKMGVLDLAFYHRAFARMRSQFPQATIYVFSDDIEAIAQEITPPGPVVWVRENQDWNASDIIRLISLCQHAIISNSTFAWWGAWLNPSSQKQIIAPTPWFGDPAADSAHITPPSWTLLPRS
jgi:hypothetical protein